MPELQFSILPAVQQELWKALTNQASMLRDGGWYLAGGTALALQLGHRRSVDFDFFSTKQGEAPGVVQWLEPMPGFFLRECDRDTIHAEIDGVKLSFIGAYRYPLLEKPLESKEMQLASLTDIGLMKLLAISHRAAPRDYIDIAAIIQAGGSLKNLLALSKEKYGNSFNPMIPLRALTSFDDLEGETPVILDPHLASSWKEIIKEAVKELAR